MSNLKISQMPAAGTLTGAETVPLLQGGGNKQTTLSDLKQYVKKGAGSPAFVLGVGAGSGATATYSGNNEWGVFELEAGSTPGLGAVVCTFTLDSFAFPNNCLCVAMAANTTAGSGSQLVCDEVSGSSVALKMPGGASLSAGQTYKWVLFFGGF